MDEAMALGKIPVTLPTAFWIADDPKAMCPLLCVVRALFGLERRA